ncbi:hypothetical protein Csa_008426 [Cucumis sativus]|uniref:Uncharacterized protein n=1 Tax=Cucumis sativus TaxID=3659 RepID=A0A0A0KTI3_CUCSA|nr:hypothetical protein Csa_008426 [Cucumis sativus]
MLYQNPPSSSSFVSLAPATINLLSVVVRRFLFLAFRNPYESFHFVLHVMSEPFHLRMPPSAPSFLYSSFVSHVRRRASSPFIRAI